MGHGRSPGRHVILPALAVALVRPHAHVEVGALGRHRLDLVALLADVGDDGAGEGGPQVVAQLGIVACGADQRLVLTEAEVAGGDDGAGAEAQHVVDVTEGLVGPAHVLGKQAADHDVVADHGLGGHVAHVGFGEVDAVALQPLYVGHVVLLGVLRPHLVHDHDHDLRRRLGERGARHHHQHQQDDQYQEQALARGSHEIPLGKTNDRLLLCMAAVITSASSSPLGAGVCRCGLGRAARLRGG